MGRNSVSVLDTREEYSAEVTISMSVPVLARETCDVIYPNRVRAYICCCSSVDSNQFSHYFPTQLVGSVNEISPATSHGHRCLYLFPQRREYFAFVVSSDPSYAKGTYAQHFLATTILTDGAVPNTWYLMVSLACHSCFYIVIRRIPKYLQDRGGSSCFFCCEILAEIESSSEEPQKSQEFPLRTVPQHASCTTPLH